MYTKETLSAINQRYLHGGQHGYRHELNDQDVDKANKIIGIIEQTRSEKSPKPGDIIQYTTDYGKYYPYAHIDAIDNNGEATIIEQPYTPFVLVKDQDHDISFSTSGGSFHFVPSKDLTYVGTDKKLFCCWGWEGPCQDGAIDFTAEVSVWKYEEPDQKNPGYSTKEYDRFSVSDSGENSKCTKETGYRFHVMSDGLNRTAFKDKDEYDAWLSTFRGKEFKDHDNSSFIVWTWKQFEKHVTPKEFDAMPQPVDTMLFNGAIRKCKRIYDEERHAVTTCFVWYWHEESELFDNLSAQNKIRDKLYMLPWGTPEFAIARGIAV